MEKNVLEPIILMNAQDISASHNTAALRIQFLDNTSMQANFTGTPAGTLSVQGSLDNVNFVTLPATTLTISAASSNLFDLNQLSFPYVRLAYTDGGTGGTGTLTVYASAKTV